MKNILKLVILVFGVLSISSCAMHNGYMNNSASLGDANFKYVETGISGNASTVYVFGIGGLNKNAIVEEAKQNMLKNYPLKANQALSNVTVNWKNGFYILWTSTKCTVTADIVEFK